MVDYRSDVAAAAAGAWNGISFSPEKRASDYGDWYSEHLNEVRQQWEEMGAKHGTAEQVAELFEGYREGHRKRAIAWLHAHARLLSPMITGPARFPVRQNEKRYQSEQNRNQELVDWAKRYRARAARALAPPDPSTLPIMAGDADALARLDAEIAAGEKRAEMMRAANKVLLNKKLDAAGKFAALVALGLSESEARKRQEPDSMGGIGFWHFERANHGAKLRRLKARRVQVAALKAAQPRELEGANARVEDAPADNRVRLHFPGKPAAEVRARLKSGGFRWAPSLGVWQAYRNPRAMALANQIAGLES